MPRRYTPRKPRVLVDPEPGAIAPPPGAYVKASKAPQVIGLLMQGRSIRQIRAETGVAIATIGKYRRSLMEQGVDMICGCGEDAGHRGWCSFRYSQSPARQAVVATSRYTLLRSGQLTTGADIMDRFRKNYTPINDEQKALVGAIKEKAEELFMLYEQGMREISVMGDANRCIATGVINLEQSVMWAVKGVTTEVTA